MPPPTITASALSGAIIRSRERIEPDRAQERTDGRQRRAPPRASQARHQLGMAELALAGSGSRSGAPLQELDMIEAVGDRPFAVPNPHILAEAEEGVGVRFLGGDMVLRRGRVPVRIA